VAIFSESHAYISPKHYDKELNVPTGNYFSVHAYGSGQLVTNAKKVRAILESTIDNYETAYREQWNNLPEDYKSKMSNGTVSFEITVTDLQGKKKLSQNKNAKEKERII
jgi:transcriptional regulator